eukprot:TRINITY_DN2243_c1_g1_i4.p1 TRINITY_DN2243_c1_g1~~TRINITY_DN2243_c1_g1_i4.p1  ORF type:complete len:457 (-),score=120.06 TRINITY_DN2243_c1_g1_i4:180-1550(-)
MLYLEDYLEMIEHLPTELREKFTEMREIDLEVENKTDSLDARQKTFFSGAGKMSATQREDEFKKIKADYEKVIDESNEKIHIAEDCYGLVDRYLRKLDQELLKFQLELEADNRGITEILEKKSLEMDAQSSNRPSMYMKENRIPKRPKQSAFNTTLERISRRGDENLAAQPSTFPLEQMGAGSTAIAAAASQALAATHYNVQTGRRSNSLKASFEAISQGLAMKDLSIGQELASAATSALAATAASSSSVGGVADSTSGGPPSSLSHHHQNPHHHQNKKQKLKHKNSAASSNSGGISANSATPSTASTAVLSGAFGGSLTGLDMLGGGSGGAGSLLDDMDAATASGLLDGASATLMGGSGGAGLAGNLSFDPAAGMGPVTPGGNSQGSDQEWNYDPNEPRYCICNQVSYGDMVACDNEDCPYEWFHYPCVGITDPPKGKWYCAPCTANMKRRGRKL